MAKKDIVIFDTLMVDVRRARETDYKQIGGILAGIVGQGDVFAYPISSTAAELTGYWCHENKQTHAAAKGGEIAGTFFIQDNQPGAVCHIGNAGHTLSLKAIGDGIGRLVGGYPIAEAKRPRYIAMQFNRVVKLNDVAVRLWKKLGFEVIGEIPDAFNHGKPGKAGTLAAKKALSLRWRR